MTDKAENRCFFCGKSGLFSQILDEQSDFSVHLRKAKIEILEGLKALIDWRLNALRRAGQKKEFTRINIDA